MMERLPPGAATQGTVLDEGGGEMDGRTPTRGGDRLVGIHDGHEARERDGRGANDGRGHCSENWGPAIVQRRTPAGLTKKNREARTDHRLVDINYKKL